MSILQFDSLEYAQELEKGGMQREHAEAIAKANTRAFKALLDAKELATKQDISELTQTTKKAITELRQETLELSQVTKQDITRLEQVIAQNKHDLEILIHNAKIDILRWIIGLLLAQSAMFFTALSYFK